MIDLRLTNQQAFALCDLVRFACQQGHLKPEEPLAQIWKKLKEHEETVVCPWCGERPATRKGLCRACRTKENRYAC